MSSWCRQRAKLCERVDLLQTMHTLHNHDKSVFVWNQCHKITKKHPRVTKSHLKATWPTSASFFDKNLLNANWQSYIASCGSGGMCDLRHKLLGDFENVVRFAVEHGGTMESDPPIWAWWYSNVPHTKKASFYHFYRTFQASNKEQDIARHRINRILKAGSHWNSRSWCGHPKDPSLAPLRWSRRATCEIYAVTWKCPQANDIYWESTDHQERLPIKIRSMNHQATRSPVAVGCKVKGQPRCHVLRKCSGSSSKSDGSRSQKLLALTHRRSPNTTSWADIYWHI